MSDLADIKRLMAHATEALTAATKREHARQDSYDFPRTAYLSTIIALTEARLTLEFVAAFMADPEPAPISKSQAAKILRAPTVCENCDNRKCMGCVSREVHDECRDDCPSCCSSSSSRSTP